MKQVLYKLYFNKNNSYSFVKSLTIFSSFKFCSRHLSTINKTLCLSVQFVTFLVVRVLCWQQNSGTTINSQILIEVSKCVESINGFKEGGWKNTFCFYKPMSFLFSLLLMNYKDWTLEVFLLFKIMY
uniref:Mediator of RNA polymerase II transcription subunit 20 n=1 Tax=Solanum lycopersicum TaxID=4081 RepID=A0A3Q7IIE8_SOLLC